MLKTKFEFCKQNPVSHAKVEIKMVITNDLWRTLKKKSFAWRAIEKLVTMKNGKRRSMLSLCRGRLSRGFVNHNSTVARIFQREMTEKTEINWKIMQRM